MFLAAQFPLENDFDLVFLKDEFGDRGRVCPTKVDIWSGMARILGILAGLLTVRKLS